MLGLGFQCICHAQGKYYCFGSGGVVGNLGSVDKSSSDPGHYHGGTPNSYSNHDKPPTTISFSEPSAAQATHEPQQLPIFVGLSLNLAFLLS